MTDFALARRNMIDGQLRPNRVTNAPLLAAICELPRERFLPDSLQYLPIVIPFALLCADGVRRFDPRGRWRVRGADARRGLAQGQSRGQGHDDLPAGNSRPRRMSERPMERFPSAQCLKTLRIVSHANGTSAAFPGRDPPIQFRK